MLMVALSCGQVEDGIYDPEFNVYGLLFSTQTIQEIIVDRTYLMDEPSGQYVDDALVVLSSDGYIDTLVFSSAWGKYMSSISHNLQPATTYTLSVTRVGFDTLYGSTHVPDTFSILNPVYDTLTLEDTIVFTKSIGAALYGCWVTEISTLMKINFVVWSDPDDSLESFILGEYFYNIPSSLYEISITAYDSNYYSYHFERTDSIHCAGVTGGVGLFGSSWNARKEFYIITD